MTAKRYPREWVGHYPLPLYAVTIQAHDKQSLRDSGEGVTLYLTLGEIRWMRHFVQEEEESIIGLTGYGCQPVKSFRLAHEGDRLRVTAYGRNAEGEGVVLADSAASKSLWLSILGQAEKDMTGGCE